ncbi:MAG: DUF2203 family protein [Planctomycetota bacterium]
MKFAYDWDEASRLVPLLEAIFNEVHDRRLRIATIEGDLARMKHEGVPESALADVVARLAVQRRELRLSLREFERLGCVVDEAVPSRVVIPGPRGRGFSYAHGDREIQLELGAHSDALQSGVH